MGDASHSDADLVFLPLGGCNEIGMNLNAYGYGPPDNRRWIVIDVGVTFGGPDTPGIDLICPDPSFLKDENIEAIFLTHAHEDHIGALGLLHGQLGNAPLYATPFTAYLIRGKLDERGQGDTPVNELSLGASVEIGPFSIQYVTLTHSIPEPNALAIRTPLGTIVHTGDWKIDPDPLIGDEFDRDTLNAIGDDGVLAMICDSTNVFQEGESGSEATVRKSLSELICNATGRVAVTTFASNVARVSTVLHAAEKAERHVCLVGRSMHKITNAAMAVGLLSKNIKFIDEDEAGFFPSDKILYLCTGSQGEPRAALSRIARGDHRHVTLSEDDTVIFSSRVIPGNESAIFAMQNALAERGIRIITEKMTKDPIHVSGHPCRDELRRMYQWVRPKISVPVHGERRHILEHAAYAKSLQVPQAVTPRNGDLIRLAPGAPKKIDEVPNGRLFLDGVSLVPEGAEGMRERRKLSYAGIMSVAVAIEETGQIIDGPLITARGFSEPDGRAADETLIEIEEIADRVLSKSKRKLRQNDDDVERLLRRTVRKAALEYFGRKPIVDINILRA